MVTMMVTKITIPHIVQQYRKKGHRVRDRRSYWVGGEGGGLLPRKESILLLLSSFIYDTINY